ncbi:MAG: hypothetical protein WC505_02450 [Patescibacteria group bacterium]
MPARKNNFFQNPKMLWAIIGLLSAGLVTAIVLLQSENPSDNKHVVVTDSNSNATNGSAVVTNVAANSNTADTNTGQIVIQNNENSSQASVTANSNANQTVVTNAQQVVVSTATTIDDTAIQLAEKQTGHCQALAPVDWSFTGNSESTGVDLFSPDQSQHAGWGISAVYTYMYPDVDSFLSAWLGYAFTGSFDAVSITFGAVQEIYDGFMQRNFTTTTGRQGTIIYKTYNFGDPTSYVVSVYMADTTSDTWETTGATPFSAMLSIRCVSQLRPTTSSVNASSSDPSSSSDNPEVSLSNKWTEAIMGYENVYSPSTGEHYEVPLTSQWEAGPAGSGYYRTLPGGGYEKLERGFGSY